MNRHFAFDYYYFESALNLITSSSIQANCSSSVTNNFIYAQYDSIKPQPDFNKVWHMWLAKTIKL